MSMHEALASSFLERRCGGQPMVEATERFAATHTPATELLQSRKSGAAICYGRQTDLFFSQSELRRFRRHHALKACFSGSG